MNVYNIYPVLDNPLFEGFGFGDHRKLDLLQSHADDWWLNYQTWVAKSLAPNWPTPEVIGNVRKFNDYPCIALSHPAFSQRAVDLLKDMLEPNGELLPVRHKIGTYYFFNCTRLVNCVDLAKSKTNWYGDRPVTDIENVVFIDEMLEGLTIFRVRTMWVHHLCTQAFVDRVNSAGLEGLVFVPVWPLPAGVTHELERRRICGAATKWKPKELGSIDIKGNTVVIRLYCERKKASKKELAAAEAVMQHLESSLYDANQSNADSYFGNVEGHDVVDREIRIFLSAPDCDRLVAHLLPSFRTMPWPGRFHVVKRRGEYVDAEAPEEYVNVT